jgi:hypothetical protein
VIRSTMLKKAALRLVAAALPLGMAIAGAAPASAGPDVCVSGPYGYAYACIDTPGWVDWYDGPRGRGHWKHGHGHGHDD